MGRNGRGHEEDMTSWEVKEQQKDEMEMHRDTDAVYIIRS